MSKVKTYGENMMITSSNWGPYKTFKLMPITEDCPFVEAIYDPSSKILAVISKVVKSSYHMVPKLDDNGDEQILKIAKRKNGKEIKEQRVLMDTHAEYYITDPIEGKDFIKMFAVNDETYKFAEIMDNDVEQIKNPLSSKKATNLSLVE